MPGLSVIRRRPARLTGLAGLAVVVAAALLACSSSATTPPAATQSTASPAAIVSEAPATSPSSEASSASPSVAASPSAAASPTASTGPGRYGGGSATPTPAPTPKTTPKPTAKPTPKPKPVSIVVKTGSTGLGKVLVGPNGLTLYTLKSDPTNGSGCTGDCAANWPAFLVKTGTTVKGGSGVSGTFATFARIGKRQVTYKGRALYYYAGDAYVGDTNGDAIGHVWYVATP